MQISLFDNLKQNDFNVEFLEVENINHKKFVEKEIRKAKKYNDIPLKLTRHQLIDWFLERFFLLDLELNCFELYEIAKKCGVNVIDTE